MRGRHLGWVAGDAAGGSVTRGNVTTYRECFEQAVGAAIAGATVLTANTRSARAIHAAAEQRLRLASAGWLSPDVLPYGAFVERLYSDAVVAGAVTLQALQREQELQLWRQIIERSPSGREMLLPEAAAALASESFRTAMEHDVPLDSSQMSASSDTRAFSGWATEFRRQLAAHGWNCAALFTRELAACLSRLRLPSQVFAFLAESTPAQRSFLDALTEAGVAVTVAPNYAAPEYAPQCEEAAPPVRYEFDGAADELRAAAQWARQQVESSPGARIGVLFFDLDRKLPQVESAFRSVLHPEHLLGQRTPAAFEIASPLALADYPVVRCALQLLSLFAAPIDFHSFHAMLRSPYLAAAPEPVARFVAGVRKHARRQVSFDDLARWLHESDEVPELRAALGRLPRHAAFSSEQPVAYWAKISREILQAFGWPAPAAGAACVALDSEEFQCTKAWGELFSAISSLELLEWRTDFRGFVARLERAAATQNFKPETRDAPVQIMDLAESEGSVFDALWIGGCSDEQWPDSPRLSPLIPVALLKAAGVAVAGTPQAEARIARLTSRLLQSAPRLSLSLALRSDDEREQRWSPFFAEFALASEQIHVLPLNVPPPLAECFAPVALDAISDATAPALASGEPALGGTSLLQDQSNCPFRAFAIRRLLAREDEGPNEALAPTERGKIIDRALQLIWEQLQDSQGLHRPDCSAIIADAVDAAMASELPPGGDPWTLRFRALERQRTIEVLTQWLAVEARRKPFHVVGHQLPVEVTLGGLSLRGRLDRLDEIGDAHVVIDYKTGAANSVSAWQVPRPRLPQLPFYAFAMLQQKFDLAGISFATVRRGECGFKGYLREKHLLPCAAPTKRSFDGMAFDDYTARWAEELERIATSFVQGDAAVNPRVSAGKSGSPCEHCHLGSLCRVGDLAAGAGDDSECEPTGESDE
jgi:ATP-dependent helicase/nuclease subunit B